MQQSNPSDQKEREPNETSLRANPERRKRTEEERMRIPGHPTLFQKWRGGKKVMGE